MDRADHLKIRASRPVGVARRKDRPEPSRDCQQRAVGRRGRSSTTKTDSLRRSPPDSRSFPKLPLTTDCSGFVNSATSGHKRQPNAMNYNGTGYTGTMLHACSHIQPRAAQLADLVVFGNAPGTHVVIIVQLGSDPMVVSHGSEDGPLKLRLSQEATSHPGQPLTYLSVAQRKSAAPGTPTKSASGGVAPAP